MGFQVNITKGDQPPVGASQDDLFIRTSDGAIFYNNGLLFVPITAAPSGVAGGVLSGTYPNPGMAAGAAAANLGAAGGSLSGTYPNPGLAAGAATGAALGSDVVKNNAANALTAAGTIDASLASDTTGLKLPSKAGAAPTADGFFAFDTTRHLPVTASNGASYPWPMIPFAHQALSGASGTISGIPAGGKHLQLIIVARGDAVAAFDNVDMQFNGDTAANYDYEQVSANNVTASAINGAGASVARLGAVPAASAARANIAGTLVVWIPLYSATTFEKSYTCSGGEADSTAANSVARTVAGSWRNTAAITSILLKTSGNFVAGSTVTCNIWFT